MTAFYSDNEPYCAEWTRNLITAGLVAPGVVDSRSIAEVMPDDLRGFDHVHLFAGLSGWAHALRLAGWPDDRPVWSCSCPCQPFSQAGRRKGLADERHLWPEALRLIRECAPVLILGEQTSAPDGLAWLDVVSADLEDAGYAVGAVIIGAHSVGAPHQRNRIYFVAEPKDAGRGAAGVGGAPGWTSVEPDRFRTTRGVGLADAHPSGLGLVGREGLPDNGHPPQRDDVDRRGPLNGFWADAEWIQCAPEPPDYPSGRDRPIESGVAPLAASLPRSLGPRGSEFRRLAEMAGLSRESLDGAKRNRSGRLKAFGNSINAEQAAAFIWAYMTRAEAIEIGDGGTQGRLL